MMTRFDRNNYVYTHLFCEENIWKLIRALYTNQSAKPIEVLFVINKNRSICIFNQQLEAESQPVIWDYHVILLAQVSNEKVIFDFDSRCDFPVALADYFRASFAQHNDISEKYRPYIKAISARFYYQHFFSDRQHMKGIIESSQFPQYSCISPLGNIKKLTLSECMNMHLTEKATHILAPEEYLQRTGSKRFNDFIY